MVDYNDGKWHGWNARVNDKCPVDERDVVEIKLSDGWQYERTAGHLEWSATTLYPIVAFRVVQQYAPKPREFWVIPESGRCFSSRSSIPSAIHVREVLE